MMYEDLTISLGDMIKLTWLDAITRGGLGWIFREEADEYAATAPPAVETVGYIMHLCDGWLSMTDTLGDEQTSNVHTIPIGMIQSVEVLCLSSA